MMMNVDPNMLKNLIGQLFGGGLQSVESNTAREGEDCSNLNPLDALQFNVGTESKINIIETETEKDDIP